MGRAASRAERAASHGRARVIAAKRPAGSQWLLLLLADSLSFLADLTDSLSTTCLNPFNRARFGDSLLPDRTLSTVPVA